MQLCAAKYSTISGQGEVGLLGGLTSSPSVGTQLIGKAKGRRKAQVLPLFVALPRMARKCLHLLASTIPEGEEIAMPLRTASAFYKQLSLERGPELRPREKALLTPRVVLPDPGVSC